jgi:ABC-type uncharacterized transport system auxiliary subunit
MMRSKLQTGVMVVALLVSACAGSEMKRYYTLSNVGGPERDVPTSPKCERSVVVAAVDIVAPYDGEKIVFRTDDLEIKYFNYRLWVESPPDMIRKLISEKLERARLFGGVETYLESTSDHLMFAIKLLALEETVVGTRHHARLAIRFHLRDPQTEKIIWRHEFDTTKRVKGDSALALIEKFNEIYNDEVDALIPMLGEAIDGYQSCENPLK